MENNHRTALKSFDKGQDKDKYFWAQMQKVFAAFHKQHRTTLKAFGKGQGKDKHFQSQIRRVFAAFYKQPKTMLMVSVETGILRANVWAQMQKVFAAFHKQHRTTLKAFGKGQGKDKHFQSQIRRVFAAFYKQPKTMLMVSVETGILRANVCRYVAELQKQNRISIVRKGICPISKHRAGFYTTNYTTNPELFPSIVEPSNTVSHETCTCI